MPVDLGDSTTRSINLTNAAGAAVDADSTPTYAITKPDGSAGTSPSVQHGATGEYYVVYPTTTFGLHTDKWTALIGGVQVVIGPQPLVVEDPNRPGFIGTDEALNHLKATSVITGPVELEQLRWLTLVASDAVEDDLGIAISRRTVTETYNGGQTSLRLDITPVISITSVTESGTALTTSDYVLNAAEGRLYRGTTTTSRRFAWGHQNVTVVYVVGSLNPPRIARKVALNGVERMWQSSQQTSHPLLDDVSASAAVFAATGTLTPLEMGAYNSLRPLVYM